MMLPLKEYKNTPHRVSVRSNGRIAWIEANDERDAWRLGNKYWNDHPGETNGFSVHEMGVCGCHMCKLYGNNKVINMSGQSTSTVCDECGGTGEYQGLLTIEPCEKCQG